MPRGICYRYEFFMLISEQPFYWTPEPDDEIEIDAQNEMLSDDAEENDDDAKTPEPIFDQDAYDDFIADLRHYFKGADEVSPHRWKDREAYIIAESKRLEIGIDTGGDCACIFVLPKTYELYAPNGYYAYDEREYNITREVHRAFNKLCKDYKEVFGLPLSSIHGNFLKKYHPRVFAD